jgi:hypothetical protein
MGTVEKTVCNGLMVVRLPQWNGGVLVADRNPVNPPRIGGLEYWGVQRLPWEDIDDDRYSSHGLPPSIQRIRDGIEAISTDTTGLELCMNLEDALTMLAYSNRIEAHNELIAIHAGWLKNLKSEMLVIRGFVKWLGYDVVAGGSWSLLADGVFRRPDVFHAWTQRLNEFGLLSDPANWQTYATFYQSAAELRLVEPVPEGYPLGTLRIGRYVPPV